MKKILMTFMVGFALFFAGCTKATEADETQAAAYKAYYQVIEENTVYIEKSDYYDISAELSQLPDQTCRYCIVVDNPKIAMYSCRLMAVENDQPYSTEKIMPSVGITDTPVALIPNQVNTAGGYAKGLILDGETDQTEISLKIMVEWSDKNSSRTTREFFHCTLTADGAVFDLNSQEQS